jgi:CheY-like chemotaxis protein
MSVVACLETPEQKPMPKKILLADDSITIQKVVELTFSDGDYEVSAVNNGAKAIARLAESRPDIILSDIIMPEKNGYEVCEYVKSHPEYRTIPVVLLTGTFEPFDPDRAEKAGCDAVVTKPFESQSLIHKVEELIAAAQSAPSAAAAPAPASSAWVEEPAVSSPFDSPAPASSPADLFGSAPSAPESTTEMPFGGGQSESPFGGAPVEEYAGETRAFPRMTFEDMQKMAGETPMAAPPPPPAAPEPSPWDEPAPPAPAPFSAETRAFEPPAFDAPAFETSPAPEPESPFGAPPAAEEFSGETRAFPRMSFEDMQKMAAETSAPPAPEPPAFEPPAPAAPEPSPWEEPPAMGGETRAFPRMSFEDMQKMAAETAPPPPSMPEPSPWEEPPAAPPASLGGGETRAFPPMSSFDETPAVPETSPWEEPSEPAFNPPPTSSFADPEPEPEPLPFAAPPQEAPVEPEWSSQMSTPAPDSPSMPIARHDLTDEQVDRIARRVIELMSDSVVRNIAWEVIPDLAEMVVKERIRQLESEA